jgi:hypothetical protein
VECLEPLKPVDVVLDGLCLIWAENPSVVDRLRFDVVGGSLAVKC